MYIYSTRTFKCPGQLACPLIHDPARRLHPLADSLIRVYVHHLKTPSIYLYSFPVKIISFFQFNKKKIIKFFLTPMNFIDQIIFINSEMF